MSRRTPATHPPPPKDPSTPSRRRAVPRPRTPADPPTPARSSRRAASKTPLPSKSSSPLPAFSDRIAKAAEEWKTSFQASDPVFSSKETTRQVEEKISSGIQPWDHCPSAFFPTVAARFGLSRWIPDPIPDKGSRGPACIVEGESGFMCHTGSLPAFLYTYQNHACPNAQRRKFPTLIFRYKFDKTGSLIPFACWACHTNVDSFCSVGSLRLQELNSPSQVAGPIDHDHTNIKDSVAVSKRKADTAQLELPIGKRTHLSQEPSEAPSKTIEGDALIFSDRQLPPPLPNSEEPHQTSDPVDQLQPLHPPPLVTVSQPHEPSLASPVSVVESDASLHPKKHEQPSQPLRTRSKWREYHGKRQSRSSSQIPESLAPPPSSSSIVTVNVPPQMPPLTIPAPVALPTPQLEHHVESIIPSSLPPFPANNESLTPAKDRSTLLPKFDSFTPSHELFKLRATLESHLSAPVDHATQHLISLKQTRQQTTAILDELFTKCRQAWSNAERDRAAIADVRNERDKHASHLRTLDARLINSSQKLQAKEKELEEVKKQVQFLEKHAQTAQEEAIALDERMAQALAERDKALEEKEAAVRRMSSLAEAVRRGKDRTSQGG
ncbi:hypothetical protein TREMEDRAFT_61154 [Tremella mesenterica DSM 1558]|uniref:uncharacterized protein n=1 Tax=Tremella mesenterica (strain ATCC 24925 / CBS 8224 / DSM 1558 / NBRC 9311 / NRRL Y-6157 / RJB 2259-6 / UBC 559-6) TaxID=578456 RepID=UPI0003F4A65A|nr:uncharacterized protein TREMEDRAFT_61154 [Tremella mesenterica DSM 1558]EIW70646.1 hypothetical protein TREMEDRAFT_61154 [Tremella mesenterica DSM 1558]